MLEVKLEAEVIQVGAGNKYESKDVNVFKAQENRRRGL
jgi:hypothetical protein